MRDKGIRPLSLPYRVRLPYRRGGDSITKDTLSIQSVIATRRARAINRAGWLALLRRTVLIALIAYLVLTQAFLVTQNQGQSMYPALKDGDLCIVFRSQLMGLFGQKLARDDIIAYRVNGKRMVGRIAARGGDILTQSSDGALLVNNASLLREIMFPTAAAEDLQYPYRVPDGCYYVLGDHRTDSYDSRNHGPVSQADIEGKVISILRRRGL